MFPRASSPAIKADRTLNLGWRAIFAAICLWSLELVGCADIQQYVPWASTGAQPASEAIGSPSAASTAVTPPAEAVAPPTAVQQETAPRTHASKSAERIASQKATQASATAMKASKQAALASKEAAGAVAALQPGATAHAEEGMAKPTAPETAPNGQAPVVTLGDVPPAAPPIGDASASSDDAPGPAAGASVASAEDDIHLQADRMIHEVSEESKKIDTKRLDNDEKRRQSIASRLLKSAEKSYTVQDYSAAYSLAVKASILLKPLPQTATSGSP
jgi:hypothetical protein